MSLLKRNLAPILPSAWRAIDAEARRVLALNLAARKLVDFDGPRDPRLASVHTGRLEKLPARRGGALSAALYEVQALVELRAPMTLDLEELDSIERGADDPDLDAVTRAAETIAYAEDDAVFNGYEDANIRGIVASSPHAPMRIASPIDYPRAIADAIEVLRRADVNGPYGLALGSTLYDEVSAAVDEGYPIVKRLERQLDGGAIVCARALEGAVLLSMRGGDFRLTVGRDLSVGYTSHSTTEVALYVSETFTFRVLEPKAAVVLTRA